MAPDTAEYDPAQIEHVFAPKDVLNVPALQLRQVREDEAPGVAEYFPAPQLRHTLAAVAPELEEYVPATQSVHVVAPDAAQAPAVQVTAAAGTTTNRTRKSRTASPPCCLWRSMAGLR